MKRIVLFFVIIFLNKIKCSQCECLEPIKVGNFSVIRPFPVISFGQLIIPKGTAFIFFLPDYLKGCKKSFTELTHSFLYGIRDDLYVALSLPLALKYKLNGQISQGVQDLTLQMGYAFYTKKSQDLVTQISLITNVTFPTGSAVKRPPTGIGSASFFIGPTLSQMRKNWYYFVSIGGIFPSPRWTDFKKSKFGNQCLYQCGLSKNICYKANCWLFNWMIELDGYYKLKDKNQGKIDINTGGTQILLTPSLLFASNTFYLQGGISWYFYQNLNGIQNKDNYYAAVNIGVQF